MLARLVLFVVATAIPAYVGLSILPRVGDLSLSSGQSGVLDLVSPRRQPLRASDDTGTTPGTRRPFALDPTPPATIAPLAFSAVATPAPAATPTREPARERAVIYNTGGIGAAVRSAPGGPQVTGLREGQLVEVLERSTGADGREWLRVRIPDGREGWIIGLVAQRQ